MSRLTGEFELALALEGRVKAAPENAQLVVIAEALSNLPDPEIDPTFMLALEQRLLTEELADQQAAPARRLEPVPAAAPVREVIERAPVVQMPKRRFVVRRSLVAMAAAASLAAFPVVAAAQSLPGSPFHSIKLKIEQMQIALFGTPVEDARQHLENANTRIDEVQQLQALGGSQDDIALGLYLVQVSLNKASELVASVDDPATLRSIAEQAHATELRLRETAPALTAAVEEEFAGALGTSLEIQNEIAEALGLTTVEATTEDVSAMLGTSFDSRTEDSGSAAKSSDVRDGSGDKDPGDRNGGPKDDDDEFNPGKTIDDPIPGCYIPGSENGLGDLGAPVAKVMCSV